MEAIELRTNNLVNYISGNKERAVKLLCVDITELSCKVVALDQNEWSKEINKVSLGNIRPIVLNEEWLLQFGFVENGFGGYEKSWKASPFSDMHTTYRVFRGDVGFSLYEHGYEIKNGIEHVHQLQNGWHFLTRAEELTISDQQIAP